MVPLGGSGLSLSAVVNTLSFKGGISDLLERLGEVPYAFDTNPLGCLKS